MNMAGIGFIERIPVRAQRIDKTEIKEVFDRIKGEDTSYEAPEMKRNCS